jgi:O-antigen ligase
VLKMNLLSKEVIRKRIFFFFYYFSIVAIGLGLLLSGVVIGLLLGGRVGNPGLYLGFGVIAAIAMSIIIAIRQDELAVTGVIVVSLCIDWYLGLNIVSPIMALALLLIFYFARSSRYPWIESRPLLLWILFLGLSILPAIRGFTSLYDFLYYYPNLIGGAFIMFWLGSGIARNVTSVRRFFNLLAGFGTLVAVHLIIEATTGQLLFATSSLETFLALRSDYSLGIAQVSRYGSFFVQPDAGSAFLAMMLFIPLGLFVESSSLLKKALYFAELLLIIIALLFTFSTGAFLAAGAGILTFALLAGSTRYRVQMVLYTIISAAVLFFGFPSQVNLLIQHAYVPTEASLRQGLWETAWRVIRAFPLTGIGLSRAAYLQIADAYRVPAQYVAENNPHNSYLELGAMAGLPVLFVFLALLLFALWQALRNWARVDKSSRPLLGCGIAAIIVLCFNSLTFGLWTLPPMAAAGWLILGVVASPLLSRGVVRQITTEKNP